MSLVERKGERKGLTGRSKNLDPTANLTGGSTRPVSISHTVDESVIPLRKLTPFPFRFWLVSSLNLQIYPPKDMTDLNNLCEGIFTAPAKSSVPLASTLECGYFCVCAHATKEVRLLVNQKTHFLSFTLIFIYCLFNLCSLPVLLNLENCRILVHRVFFYVQSSEDTQSKRSPKTFMDDLFNETETTPFLKKAEQFLSDDFDVLSKLLAKGRLWYPI